MFAVFCCHAGVIGDKPVIIIRILSFCVTSLMISYAVQLVACCAHARQYPTTYVH